MVQAHVSALVVVQVLSLVGGVTAVATHHDSKHHRRAVAIAPTDGSTVDPIPVPTPTAADSPSPEPEVSPSPDTSSALVVGPPPPTANADAKADLEARMLQLNPDTTVQEPDAPIHGGFRDLDELTTLFDDDATHQRALLQQEGFQGSEYRAWASTSTTELFLVDVQRFATKAGAAKHLTGFLDGPRGGEGRLHHAASPIPSGVAFQGLSQSGKDDEVAVYQARGNYFCIVTVKAAKGDAEVSTAQLALDAARLSKAVRDRMA